MADSLLARVREITLATDEDLAKITGLSAHTIESYRTGRRTEYLNTDQIQALKAYLADYEAMISEAVAEFDLYA